jgi:hypothetical protein
MNKDAVQKQKAIRFCVANRVVPYLEVVVRYVGEVADIEADISDVDVLGIRPSSIQDETKTIFDCKTLNRVSAISRAMWAAGLMRLIDADEAYVILNKAAPEGHRLASNYLGVRLTSEALFDNLGRSISPVYTEGFTYLDDLGAWAQLARLSRSHPGLQPMLHFLGNIAPLERDATKGFRTLIHVLKQTEGEFDNTKPEHKALWGLLVCEAMRFLAEIAVSFHHIFDPSMGKTQFENLLRNYIWGGRESYAVRQKLHVAIRSGRPESEISNFELPGWERLVELVRGFLDAPHLVGTAVLPVRDLTIGALCTERPNANRRIRGELDSNARARQFALQTNRYLGSLSKLLKDCSENCAAQLSAA